MHKTYIRPAGEGFLVERRLKEESPENDSYQEWVTGDSRVQQGVESTTETWPAVEEHGASCPRIAGCVNGREQEVEAQTPVGQPGEVAEGLADRNAITVGAIPCPDDDDGGEDV
jgi:hypothetical protein